MNSLQLDSSHYRQQFLQSQLNSKLQDPNIAKRRSKNDNVGRNFVCGCGKKYLSYPALYTHIKKKHNGSQPEGTKALNTSNQTKRGRPKKLEGFSKSPNLFQSLHVNSNKNIDSNLTHGEITVQNLKSINCLTEIDILGTSDPLTFYGVDNQGKEHPFVQIFKKLQQEQQIENYLLQNPTCDNAICVFLFYLSRFIRPVAFKYFNIFFKFLREFINKYGQQVVKDYVNKKNQNQQILLLQDFNENLIIQFNENKNNNQNQQLEYSQYTKADIIPLVSNRFILDYLSVQCPLYDQQFAIQLMRDFSEWLERNNLTKYKIDFNLSKYF